MRKGKWCFGGCILVKTAPDDLHPVRNQRIQEQEDKAQTIEIIERWCKAKKVYKSMQEGYSLIREPRKEVQCAFRLINILFLMNLHTDFATVANREILDSGKAGNKMHFWEQVQDAFVGSD
jgi:hypothetical protein